MALYEIRVATRIRLGRIGGKKIEGAVVDFQIGRRVKSATRFPLVTPDHMRSCRAESFSSVSLQAVAT